jgi:hypothetical protein
MQNYPFEKARRHFLVYTALGAIAIPLSELRYSKPALANEQLSEDDAQAKALGYKHDASQTKRPSADQQCANCQHIRGDSGEWRPCAIFPGKDVNANGWCSAWAKKI